jgi:hypothetical protein
MSIVSTLNITIQTIVPAVTGTVLPLATNEVTALIGALKDVESMVSDIKSTLESTVSTVGAGKSFLRHYTLSTNLAFRKLC